jgi:hypothetical protein
VNKIWGGCRVGRLLAHVGRVFEYAIVCNIFWGVVVCKVLGNRWDCVSVVVGERVTGEYGQLVGEVFCERDVLGDSDCCVEYGVVCFAGRRYYFINRSRSNVLPRQWPRE